MANEGKKNKVDGRNLGSSSVQRCICAHKFQDKKYGKGVRVHNKSSKGWRCSVCHRDN